MSSSAYSDLSRPPLREVALTRALVVPGARWSRLRVVTETGSTNADVVAAARDGAAEGLVLVAESQTAGRGRLDRHWEAPPRAGLTVSLLLRPPVPLAKWGWLSLLAGVAVVEAVSRVGVVDARLKWPNDVLVRSAGNGDDEFGKAAGILAESAGADAVVIGVGLNVSQRRDELPPPAPGAFAATSLGLVGAASVDRDPLLRAMLRSIDVWYGRWLDADADADACGLRDVYRELCFTLGQAVDVSLPGGGSISGEARDIDADGRLVVRSGSTEHALAAGDVRHVR